MCSVRLRTPLSSAPLPSPVAAPGRSRGGEPGAAACGDQPAAHPGGARVVVPAGAFKTGAILLRSNMELHIAKGAGLYGSTDPADYPIVQVRKLNGRFSSLTFLR